MTPHHRISPPPGIAAVTARPGPAPLGEGFRAGIRRRSSRAIELIAASLPPGAPSGMWCRTAGTDYLYVEGQTSPFHQLHIQPSLAARVLLSNPSGLTDQAA